MNCSRRDFLLVGSLAGASFLLHCRRPGPGAGEAAHRLNFWLAVHADDTIELRVSKLEVGQGTWTVLAQLTAEELEVELSSLRLVVPSTDDLRGVPPFDARTQPKNVLEGGASMGVALSWLPVRTAAAAAREMLVEAAANEWRVPSGECRAALGAVVHAPSGRTLRYGKLASRAARLSVPAAPRLKTERDQVLVGRPTPRFEGPEIVAGRARFSTDVRQRDQRYAALARPPLGAIGPPRFDEAAARSVRGVEAVFQVTGGLAVVADNSWSAICGRARSNPEWDESRSAEISSKTFEREMEEALDAPLVGRYQPASPDAHVVQVASRGRMPAWSDCRLEARYATSFQAHAAMETPNAVVRFDPSGRCEIWCGTQHPRHTQQKVAEAFGLELDRVVIHPQRMGGSFGRKESADFVLEAVDVARSVPGTPVQLLWSRDDDLHHDLYHPPSRHRLAARLKDDRLAAWRHRLSMPSAMKQGGLFAKKKELIPRAESAGAWNLPYGAGEVSVEYVDPPCPFPLGPWRGIATVANVFAVESFVDELAHTVGVDPLEFRLRNLGDFVAGTVRDRFPLSRLRVALELAASRAGWGEPLSRGKGRGLAGLVFDGRTACASVAEVAVEAGAYRVERFVCAVDCGIVVNPLGLAGQIESAVAWGLSALDSEITFERGRAQQSSHLDYPILRLPRMPTVEIAVVPSTEPPSGIGEIPVPTVAPAVANAIFHATGRRLRRLPFRSEDLA